MRSASEAATEILLSKVQSEEKEKINKRKKGPRRKGATTTKVVCQLVANVAATKWLAVQAAATKTQHSASGESRRKSQVLRRIIRRFQNAA